MFLRFHIYDFTVVIFSVNNEYFLQAAIYSEALRRYLCIIDKKPFDEIFGGAFYIFLRGLDEKKAKNQGIYHFIPDLLLLKQTKYLKRIQGN